MVDFDEEKLQILYKVNYNNSFRSKGYPQFRNGYEKMYLDFNNTNDNGKITVLKGNFWHCVSDDGKSMFMGDVTYTRE